MGGHSVRDGFARQQGNRGQVGREAHAAASWAPFSLQSHAVQPRQRHRWVGPARAWPWRMQWSPKRVRPKARIASPDRVSLGVPMRGPPPPGWAVRNGPYTAMGWTNLSGRCEAHCRPLGSPTPRVVVCRAKASPLRHPCRLSPEANIDVASDGANSQLVRNPGLLGGALAGLLHSSRACWTGKES